MSPVTELRNLKQITQTELAELANTSQATIAMYETNKKSPNLRTLLNLATSVDLEFHFNIVPIMTRDQKRSLAFHQEIVKVLRRDFDTTILKAQTNIKTMLKANPNADDLLDEWKTLLGANIELLIIAILDPTLRGRDRRQVSPFAGILTAKQRTKIIKKFRKNL